MARDQECCDDDEEGAVAPFELEPGAGIGREDRGRERADGNGTRDQETVEEVAAEGGGFERAGELWTVTLPITQGSFRSEVLGADVPVAELYRGVDLLETTG